jgi:hypothetical protein
MPRVVHLGKPRRRAELPKESEKPSQYFLDRQESQTSDVTPSGQLSIFVDPTWQAEQGLAGRVRNTLLGGAVNAAKAASKNATNFQFPTRQGTGQAFSEGMDQTDPNMANTIREAASMGKQVADATKRLTNSNNNDNENQPMKTLENGGNGSKGGNGRGNSGNGKVGGPPDQIPMSSPASAPTFGSLPEGLCKLPNSRLDDTYWYNIFQNQESDGTKNTSRTALTVIDINEQALFDKALNVLMAVNMSSIYQDKLSQVMATTGGNVSVRDSFTYEKFWDYHRYAWSALLMLCEVYSYRVWNPPFEETNTVLRSLKNHACSDIDLARACIRLEEAIANYAIPRDLIDLGISYFQTYKKSPISGGVHWKRVSFHLMSDFVAQSETTPFANTIVQMNSLSNTMISTTGTSPTWSHDAGVITSFLLQKCQGYTSCRSSKTGSGYPVYSAYLNAINDNVRYSFGNSSTTYVSVDADWDAYLQIAYPMDKGNVPLYVTSQLLLNYGGSSITGKAGYPFHNLKSVGSVTNYICTNDTTRYFEVNFEPVASDPAQILDMNYHINPTFNGTRFKPSGMNTQLFQPTFDVVNNATREYMYQIFDMPTSG